MSDSSFRYLPDDLLVRVNSVPTWGVEALEFPKMPQRTGMSMWGLSQQYILSRSSEQWLLIWTLSQARPWWIWNREIGDSSQCHSMNVTTRTAQDFWNSDGHILLPSVTKLKTLSMVGASNVNSMPIFMLASRSIPFEWYAKWVASHQSPYQEKGRMCDLVPVRMWNPYLFLCSASVICSVLDIASNTVA